MCTGFGDPSEPDDRELQHVTTWLRLRDKRIEILTELQKPAVRRR